MVKRSKDSDELKSNRELYISSCSKFGGLNVPAGVHYTAGWNDASEILDAVAKLCNEAEKVAIERAETIESIRAQIAELKAENANLLAAGNFSSFQADKYMNERDELKAENERLQQWNTTAFMQSETHKAGMYKAEAERDEYKEDAEELRELVSGVETQYFALLKEKDIEAETFKVEGDMYGWNFHTGERAGAMWMHLFMTELLKACNTQAAKGVTE